MKDEEPKKPKALFTISLELRWSLFLSICCFYFVNLISLDNLSQHTKHADFYLNSSPSNTFFCVFISVTVQVKFDFRLIFVSA